MAGRQKTVRHTTTGGFATPHGFRRAVRRRNPDGTTPSVPSSPPSSIERGSPTDTDARADTAASIPRPSTSAARRYRTRLFVADAATVLLGCGVAMVIWMAMRPVPAAAIGAHLMLFAASFPVWLAMLVANKLYMARVIELAGDELKRIWAACAISTTSIVGLAFAFQYRSLSRSWIAVLLVTIGVALTLERYATRVLFRRMRRAGRMTRRVVMIGTDTNAIHMVHTLQSNPGLGYTVVGFIGDQSVGTRGGVSWLGGIDATERLLAEHQCIGAIMSLSSVPADDVNRLTRRLTDSGFHVALASNLRDIMVTRIRPQSIDGRTVLYIEPTIRDGWRAAAKRVFDITVSLCAVVATAPIMAVAAIAVKFTSPGPVFFRQVRVGVDGREFEICKFRTMVADAEHRRDELLHRNESDGPLFKIADDPRVTRVGRHLRSWSIDELPQFFNVLRGDMSVVGPRPALPNEVAEWDDEVHERLRVLPGITGTWQVSGRSDASFDVYKRLDLFYVDNWSLLHDLKIVAMTFAAVAARRGAR